MFDQHQIERVMKTLGFDEEEALKHLRSQEVARQFYQQQRQAAIQTLLNRIHDK